jgi:DNA-binding PadR family transcriptional regulator
MRSYLKIFVLKLLSSNDLTGYSLIKQIEKKANWKPSPGSMYPLLKNLLKNDYVNVKLENRLKLYSITKKGKIYIGSLLKNKSALANNVVKNFKVYENVSNKKDSSFALEIISKIDSDEIPFREISKELCEFRDVLFELNNKKLLYENKSSVQKIFRETIKNLKKIK